MSQKEQEGREVAVIPLVQDEGALVPYNPAMLYDPVKVLEDATRAAKVLQDVIATKKNPAMFNGEIFLEFEDWQTVGRFYGVSSRTVSTSLIQIGNFKGYEAVAEAFHISSGIVLSRTESMCLSDERTWSNKPLFQMRSMAQTRACAKAMRNVLSYVPVLAGYRATPAEELELDDKPRHAQPVRTPAPRNNNQQSHKSQNQPTQPQPPTQPAPEAKGPEMAKPAQPEVQTIDSNTLMSERQIEFLKGKMQRAEIPQKKIDEFLFAKFGADEIKDVKLIHAQEIMAWIKEFEDSKLKQAAPNAASNG